MAANLSLLRKLFPTIRVFEGFSSEGNFHASAPDGAAFPLEKNRRIGNKDALTLGLRAEQMEEGMKTLETGEEKIRRICEQLRAEGIEPGKREAERLVTEAEKRAKEILAEAEAEAESLHSAAKAKMEQERTVFASALEQAAQLALERLRQKVEELLLDGELAALAKSEGRQPGLVAKLIAALVEGIEREGISSDLVAFVPKGIEIAEVKEHLAAKILERLKEGRIAIGDFSGGAALLLKDKRMTLEISDVVLKELLASYVRKDFRKMIFRAG